MEENNRLYSLLKKTQKYTKTDNIYLVSGGFYLTLKQIITTACALLLAVCYSHFLPKETYGHYKYILSIAGILAVFILPGMRTAVVRAIAKGKNSIFLKGTVIRLRWSLLASLASLVFTGYFWIIADNIHLALSFLLLAIVLPLTEVTDLYLSYLQGKKDFKNIFKYSSIVRIVSLISIAIAVILTNNLIIVILTYFLSNAIPNIFFSFRIHYKIKKEQPKKENIKKDLSFGKHLSLVSIISSVANYFDQILAYSLLGPISLALYSFAIIPINHINDILVRAMKSLVLPRFATRKREEIRTTIGGKFWRYLAATVFIIAVYVFAAPYLFKIFFPQYVESVFYSQVFSLTLITAPVLFFGTALTAHMMKREIYISNTATAIFKIIALVILVKFFGLWGLIFARIITQLFSGGLTFGLFKFKF